MNRFSIPIFVVSTMVGIALLIEVFEKIAGKEKGNER